MSKDSKSNIIRQRIELLQADYQSFSTHPTAQICLWLLEASEYPLIESFFKYEVSIAASSPDLFLKFEAPFQKKQTYTRALFDELVQNVTSYRANDNPTQVAINWQPKVWAKHKQEQPDFFLQNIAGFAKGVEDLESNILIFLAPPSVYSFEDLEAWLIRAIELGIPKQVRLMLVDFEQNQQFKKLVKQFPKQVMSISPQLDMPQAMKEIAIAAGGNKPGAIFQNHFIDLTTAASKGNMPKVERAANKAMAIATEQGWTHLQIVVLTTVGSAWMGQNDMKKALTQFEEAEKFARLAHKNEEDNASRHLANTLFSIGTIYVHTGKHRKGASTYEQVVPIMEAEEDIYLTMEAWRMAAYCHEQGNNYAKAIECNQAALHKGETLKKEQQENSTLPFIGAALVRLYKRRAAFRQIEEVEAKMKRLFGETWKDRTKIVKKQ